MRRRSAIADSVWRTARISVHPDWQLRGACPMYTSGGPTESRSAPRRSVHVDFDLRVAFAAERRLLPALLLIGLVAAFASMRAGANALALAWLALYGVNAAIRFLIATEYATAPREVSAETRGGQIYLATAVADVVAVGSDACAGPERDGLRRRPRRVCRRRCGLARRA